MMPIPMKSRGAKEVLVKRYACWFQALVGLPLYSCRAASSEWSAKKCLPFTQVNNHKAT
jgi:hypothetical protein